MKDMTTMRELQVIHLGRDQLRMAYAVVQAVTPEISFDQWKLYAAELMEQRGRRDRGILGVRDQRGYFLGLATYHKQIDLRRGCVLVVDDLIAFDLFRREQIASALMQAVEHLAAECGCLAVRMSVPAANEQRDGSWLGQMLESHGHALEHTGFCKAMPAAE